MTDAWDAYSATKPQRREVNAAGESTWFNWTQYPDHGPGAELVEPRPGAEVVDLGCGKGGNAAHLAALGCAAIGVDVSRPQLAAAHERWDTSAQLRWVQQDAVAFLAGERSVHAVFSVFGALHFTDPALILPAAHDVLEPGGRLGLNQQPPIEDCYGCQAAFIRRPDGAALTVKRWDYPPSVWRAMLVRHGFDQIEASVLPGPDDSDGEGTLLVRARKVPT